MPTWAILGLGISAVVIVGIPGNVAAKRYTAAREGGDDQAIRRERKIVTIVPIVCLIVWVALLLTVRHAYLG